MLHKRTFSDKHTSWTTSPTGHVTCHVSVMWLLVCMYLLKLLPVANITTAVCLISTRCAPLCYGFRIERPVPWHGVQQLWGLFSPVWWLRQRCYPASCDLPINPTILKRRAQWIQWVVATLASHNRASAAAPLLVKETCCQVWSHPDDVVGWSYQLGAFWRKPFKKTTLINFVINENYFK